METGLDRYEYVGVTRRSPAPSNAFVIAGLLAVLGLILTVAGPAFSHHYAELSPSHTHLFTSDNVEHSHTLIGSNHVHDGSGVVNVSDGNGVGAATLHIAPPSHEHVTPEASAQELIASYGFVLAVAIPPPPDKPPIPSWV